MQMQILSSLQRLGSVDTRLCLDANRRRGGSTYRHRFQRRNDQARRKMGNQISPSIKVTASYHDSRDRDADWRLVRSGYGHDKSQAILPYRKLPEPPLLFFLGDGVSGKFSSLPF